MFETTGLRLCGLLFSVHPCWLGGITGSGSQQDIMVFSLSLCAVIPLHAPTISLCRGTGLMFSIFRNVRYIMLVNLHNLVVFLAFLFIIEPLLYNSEFYTNTFYRFKQHHITFLAPDVESLSFSFVFDGEYAHNECINPA